MGLLEDVQTALAYTSNFNSIREDNNATVCTSRYDVDIHEVYIHAERAEELKYKNKKKYSPWKHKRNKTFHT